MTFSKLKSSLWEKIKGDNVVFQNGKLAFPSQWRSPLAVRYILAYFPIGLLSSGVWFSTNDYICIEQTLPTKQCLWSAVGWRCQRRWKKSTIGQHLDTPFLCLNCLLSARERQLVLGFHEFTRGYCSSAKLHKYPSLWAAQNLPAGNHLQWS